MSVCGVLDAYTFPIAFLVIYRSYPERLTGGIRVFTHTHRQSHTQCVRRQIVCVCDYVLYLDARATATGQPGHRIKKYLSKITCIISHTAVEKSIFIIHVRAVMCRVPALQCYSVPFVGSQRAAFNVTGDETI